MIGIAAAGFTAMIVAANPALADTYEYQIAVQGDYWAHEDAYSGNFYGEAVYERGGDEIYVKDTEKDNMRVAAFWSIPSIGRTGLCVNTGGEQSLRECNKSFPEGKTIYIRFAGRCDGSHSACNKLSQYTDGAATDSSKT
ncbi:hypothetical protein [Jatrophihabitans endophyticus]|uniref:hypothetical protein n=1 Tax=Jatrophihabitans endophyticus TaxID=1206085 RepID=UPI001160E5DC|nr:hypothetical protein [Jatrophihabitans endophyticus]